MTVVTGPNGLECVFGVGGLGCVDSFETSSYKHKVHWEISVSLLALVYTLLAATRGTGYVEK